MNRLDTKRPWGTEKGRQKPLHPTPPTHTQGLWVKCPGSAGGGEKTLEAPPPSPAGRWGGPGARQASARPHSTGLSQGGCDPCPAPSPPPRIPLIGPNNFTLWSPDGACFGCPSGPSSPTPGCITGGIRLLSLTPVSEARTGATVGGPASNVPFVPGVGWGLPWQPPTL